MENQLKVGPDRIFLEEDSSDHNEAVNWELQFWLTQKLCFK